MSAATTAAPARRSAWATPTAPNPLDRARADIAAIEARIAAALPAETPLPPYARNHIVVRNARLEFAIEQREPDGTWHTLCEGSHAIAVWTAASLDALIAAFLETFRQPGGLVRASATTTGADGQPLLAYGEVDRRPSRTQRSRPRRAA